jgi:hypothetical protein
VEHRPEQDSIDGQGHTGGAATRVRADEHAMEREGQGCEQHDRHDVQGVDDRRVRPVTEPHPAGEVRDCEEAHRDEQDGGGKTGRGGGDGRQGGNRETARG